MKKIILLFLISSFYNIKAQDKFTVSGYAKDAKNGEALIGVTVYKKNSQIGTSTNVYGFYSLTLPKGQDTVVFSFMGYKTVFMPVDLSSNQTLSLEMAEEGKELEEVVVSSDKEDKNVKSMEINETGELVSSHAIVKLGLGAAFAFIIYFFIFLYGVQVMRGVMEEKTNRIVEIIISSVRPFQLMMGKILGIAMVGLTQFLIWVFLSVGITTVVSLFYYIKIPLYLFIKKSDNTIEIISKSNAILIFAIIIAAILLLLGIFPDKLLAFL